MELIIGKLYRLVKGSIGCIGCVLKYEGFNKLGGYCGKPIKLGKNCQPGDWSNCPVFKRVIDYPDEVKLVEYESMTKFCKKLRKERKVK